MKLSKTLRVCALVLLVLFASYGVVVVGNYIGYATFQGRAGNIYELVIKHHIPVDQWSGMYGVAVRVDGYTLLQSELFDPGSIEGENLLFDCLAPDIEHEIYASIYSDFDTTNLVAATTTEIDNFYGLNTSAVDAAANTFLSNITFELGTTSLTVPGTFTYKINDAGGTDIFATGIVKDGSGRLGFVIIITSNFTEGYNGEVINYQALLPMLSNQSQTRYYFFTDPNDQCPAGQGEAPPECTILGNVSDQGGTRLQNVIVERAGSASISDSQGSYNLSSAIGTYRIYGILEGYKTYVNNVTCIENDTITHNIVMIQEVDNPLTGVGPGQDSPGDQTESGIGPGQDVGPGVGPGEDVGPGEAPPVPFVEEPKEIEGTDYIISLSEIKRKIRIDSFHQESLSIYSFKKSTVSLTLEPQGENLTNILTLSKNTVLLDPDGSDQVIITIWGHPPAQIYRGNLTIDGEINATIPVEIEILPRDKIPVEALLMNLETSKKSVLPGNPFKFKADLRNLMIDQQYPVNLLFTIQNSEGNETIWTFTTNVYLKTAFSLIRTVELPKNLPPGDYILRASASYLNLASSTDTIFSVEVPFWSKTVLGLKNWIWAIIFLALLAGAAAGFFIWRNIQGKKKYHLKVEYAELPKPGPRNIYVGKIAETENKTYFNLENFKVHTIVAGSTGGGKSVSAQIVVEEALERDVAVICFDPTAQWTGMLRPCKDKTMISLYPFFGMKKTDVKAYNGNIRMITNPKEKIDIKKYAKPGEIQVFACHKLDPKDMDVVVANAIREIFHANFQESKPLKILFVFDEVHRLLPKFGGSGDGFLQIERGCREFRKWGLGIMLVSQVLSDFVGTIKANINTEIQMRTRDEGDLERIRQKYGEDVLRSLVKATVGSGMVENPAYNRGKPYFIAFRPLKHSVERLSDDEIEQYNKYNDMVDELEFSLQQLEGEGIDIFDLKLELKLALDKVKQGNFNMVQIYIDGLKPRIDKQWQKIGKTPKPFERAIVDDAELASDLKKAQEERDQYEKDTAAAEGEKKEEKKEWGWKDDAPPDKLLNLKNGMVVLNLASLYDEISAMKDKDWEAEVGENFNTLADWVNDVTQIPELANALYAAQDQQEALKILKQFEEGKKPKDPGPPAWKQDSKAQQEQEPEKQEEAQDAVKETDPGVSQKSALQQPTAQEAPVLVNEPATESKKSVEPEDEKPIASEQNEPEKQQETIEPVVLQDEKKPPVSSDIVEAPSNSQPGQSLEQLVTQNPSEFFKLENGVELKSAKDLVEYLPSMDEQVFSNHVGQNYNHFADWVQGVFHADDLAAKLRNAKSRDEMMAVMRG